MSALAQHGVPTRLPEPSQCARSPCRRSTVFSRPAERRHDACRGSVALREGVPAGTVSRRSALEGRRLEMDASCPDASWVLSSGKFVPGNASLARRQFTSLVAQETQAEDGCRRAGEPRHPMEGSSGTAGLATPSGRHPDWVPAALGPTARQKVPAFDASKRSHRTPTELLTSRDYLQIGAKIQFYFCFESRWGRYNTM